MGYNSDEELLKIGANNLGRQLRNPIHRSLRVRTRSDRDNAGVADAQVGTAIDA